MRILHLTTSHQSNDVRVFTKECVSLAAVDSYEVWLAAAGPTPAGPVRGVPLPPVPAGRTRRLTAGFRRGMAVASELDYDVLHVHDLELLAVGIAQARRGRCVVWDSHEDFIGRFTGLLSVERQSPLKQAASWTPAALLRQMDRVAAAVVAATPSIASRYRNRRTVIVGNEARLEEFATATPSPDSRQVLFTGSPNHGQLFSEIVAAVAAIPELTLAVAGRDMQASAVLAAEAALGPRLRRLGWLDRAGLRQACSESIVGCATLADSLVATDNSSNKVFEFAAAGLPPLLSPNPSNREHQRLGDHGYMARDFTAGGIETALREACTDRDEWLQRSQLCRSWATEHGSWAKSESRLLGLYAELERGLR